MPGSKALAASKQRLAWRRILAHRPGGGARRSRSAYLLAVARAALKLAAGASITASAVLLLQLVWVALRTPRLPPPPLSGVEFVREGRVVSVSDDGGDDNEAKEEGDREHDGIETEGASSQTAQHKQREFRLVLVGDSPVEGIGNPHHDQALGGQTARAFAKTIRRDGYDRVRYWSYGKSGLTARGIKEEMVPLLHRVTDDHAQCDASGSHRGGVVHAVIVLCGVNDVLDPLSTASSFYSDVKSLLRSIRGHSGLGRAALVVLGLPDFAKLPFLPWPLCFALGLRARRMQRMLELAVREKAGTTMTAMVNIPEVRDVFTIGYHRHDSADCDDTTVPLKLKLCHPLHKHLGDRSLHDQHKLGSLGMGDFLCGDGFHPGGYGTEYIGNLVAEAYSRLVASSSAKRRGSNTAAS